MRASRPKREGRRQSRDPFAVLRNQNPSRDFCPIEAKMKRRTHSTISEIVQLPLVRDPEILCVLYSFFKYVTNPISPRVRRFGDGQSGNYLDVHSKKADGD